MLAERSRQDPLETYFYKQHPPGAWKDNLPLYDFGYSNTFQNQIAFKTIATGSVRDENIKFVFSVGKHKQNNSCDLQKFQVVIRYLAIEPTQQVS